MSWLPVRSIRSFLLRSRFLKISRFTLEDLKKLWTRVLIWYHVFFTDDETYNGFPWIPPSVINPGSGVGEPQGYGNACGECFEVTGTYLHSLGWDSLLTHLTTALLDLNHCNSFLRIAEIQVDSCFPHSPGTYPKHRCAWDGHFYGDECVSEDVHDMVLFLMPGLRWRKKLEQWTRYRITLYISTCLRAPVMSNSLRVLVVLLSLSFHVLIHAVCPFYPANFIWLQGIARNPTLNSLQQLLEAGAPLAAPIITSSLAFPFERWSVLSRGVWCRLFLTLQLMRPTIAFASITMLSVRFTSSLCCSLYHQWDHCSPNYRIYIEGANSPWLLKWFCTLNEMTGIHSIA